MLSFIDDIVDYRRFLLLLLIFFSLFIFTVTTPNGDSGITAIFGTCVVIWVFLPVIMKVQKGKPYLAGAMGVIFAVAWLFIMRDQPGWVGWLYGTVLTSLVISTTISVMNFFFPN